MRMRQLRFGAVYVAAIAMVASLPAHAQEYPTKPVTFITPAAAGNSPDVATRVVADRLTQIWKQQIVVLNRPGAGGLIAAQAAAAVEKDGYSLYVAQASTFTVLPIEQEGKLPVNLQTAFAPIGMVGEQPIALSVNKDVPAGNVAELIALANKTPDGMLFGATNRGGQSHLTGELFRERAKANISFVHAAGASVSLNDVIAGRIPIMFEGLAGLAPGIQGGGVKLSRCCRAAAPSELAEPSHHQRNRARRGVERVDRPDGAGGHAGVHHPEGQCRPPQGRRHARGDRAVSGARHLHARLDTRTNRRVHSQRRAPVVADREAGEPEALARRLGSRSQNEHCSRRKPSSSGAGSSQCDQRFGVLHDQRQAD